MKVNPFLKEINPDNFLIDYLTACGIESAKEYIETPYFYFESPEDYPNIDNAFHVFYSAIWNKKKIGILVDCDYDGFSSAACIYNFIRLVDKDIEIETFFHVGKEHGLAKNDDEDIVQEVIDANVKLLIIPDAGTNDVVGCERLSKHKIDVIVLDHHKVSEDNPFAIIVNPHLDEDNLNINLSGCGVAYKFIAYCAVRMNVDIGDLYTDLVATSIVTDVCSMLSYENRAFVKYGFGHITNPMLAAMFDKFNTRGNNPIGVSWGIGPAVNAIIRSKNQDDKIALFSAFINPDKIDDSLETAKKARDTQSKIVKEIYDKIVPNLDDSHKVLIGYSDKENKNFTGLIANKILGNYGKPCLILREYNDKTWAGSLRSPIDIADRINSTGLATCRGHEAACGIFVPKSNLDKLIDWFDKQDFNVEPIKNVTACLNPGDITLPLCHACQDNMMIWSGSESANIPQPKFYISIDVSPSDVSVFKKKTTTVKIVKDGVNFLKFRVAKDVADSLQSGRNKIEMIATLEVNEWNGVYTPQVDIEEWEITPKEKKEEFIDNSEFDWDEVFK